MPRAAGNSATGALRRNQACKQCRKRKLFCDNDDKRVASNAASQKCDAQRPHCGTCQRQWQVQISVPPPVGYVHPTEPTCTYDPIDGLQPAPDTVENPVDKVKVLETQIAELAEKLNAARTELQRKGNDPEVSPSEIAYQHQASFTFPANSTSPDAFGLAGQGVAPPSLIPSNSQGASVYSHQRYPSQASEVFSPLSSHEGTSQRRPYQPGRLATPIHPYAREQTQGSGVKTDRRFNALGSGGLGLSNDLSGGGTAYLEDEPSVAMLSKFGRQNQYSSARPSMYQQPSEPIFDIMQSGWSPDLPDRISMVNYIDIYFKCDPCSSRMLHKPSLMNAINLAPTHPDFPHPALLHAICATASRWTSCGRADIGNIFGAQSPSNRPIRDKFAEFHANKTRQYVNQTMSHGENIFQVWQACIILSWWFYCEGRWVEVWIQAGFQTRAAIPLGLNYLGMIKRGPDGNVVRNAYLEPPRGLRELEARKRAWWMALMFDRIVSVGGWLHSVDERDIGTELPLRALEYELELEVHPNPQTLHTVEVFIRHPIAYTDPYILFLKSIMLFGRVTDYTVRMGIRSPLVNYGRYEPLSSPGMTGITPPTSSMGLGSPPIAQAHGSPIYVQEDPRNAPGFKSLDHLVSTDFLECFPALYRNCLGVGMAADGTNLDTDLYLAHLVPHAAVITLHSPWINFALGDKCPSVARCMQAARAILDKYYLLRNTSFDITWLHPFVTICWYLAAVVQIHLCKRLIEQGELVLEASCWGEINLLRDALITYGAYCPIGSRQEKLLHPIMKEIIDMTSQEKPLSVGLPLYPFSLDTAFQKEERKAAITDGATAGVTTGIQPGEAVAPLPDAAYADDVIMADVRHAGTRLTLPPLGRRPGMWGAR